MERINRRSLMRLTLYGVMLNAASAPIATARQGGDTAKETGASVDRQLEEVEPAESARFRRSGGVVSLPPGTNKKADVAYGPDPRHRLDIFLPDAARDAPIFLFVHGGAWMVGDKGIGRGVSNKVQRWLPRGYVFVSINYRFPSPPDPAAQAEDVARAIAFVQQQARTWGANPARFLLAGHSAGAHLASLVTVDDELRKRFDVRDWSGTVSLDSAAMDVVSLMERPHPRLYDRVFGTKTESWRQVSPLHRMTSAPVPMLLVCSKRRADSCPQSNAFAAKAKSFGGNVSVLPVDLNHGDINAQLGVGGSYTDAVEAFTRGIGLP